MAAPESVPRVSLASATPDPPARLTSFTVEAERPDVVAVPVLPADGGQAPRPGPHAVEVAERYGIELTALLAREKAKGEAGEVTAVPVTRDDDSVRWVLFAGLGDGGAVALRRAGAALARRTKGRTLLTTSLVVDTSDALLRAFTEGLLLGSYRFTHRSASRSPGPLTAAVLLVDDPAARQAALDRAVATGVAVWRSREMTNTPSHTKTPTWLTERASELAAEAGLAVAVRDAAALATDGFGGILAVGRGSAQPPCLIELAYTPAGAAGDVPHVVLVGKGITYDTGGLSLKPRESMTAMKTDMAAGGAVLAAMAALPALGVRARVTGLIAAAENMPSGSAYRPGDVIRHYGGTTVEVFNTDAEGRLVLADALAYACQRLAPDVVVDLATLTGAATLGLGRRHAALYATDDALADALIAAGAAGGERLWRMPLVEDYRFGLNSEVADLSHVSRQPTLRGESISAALFLREFVDGRPWAHLDIAGPARADGDEHEVTSGGTGFGTRTLLRWLESLPAPPAGDVPGRSGVRPVRPA